ncbi:MAG: LysR family transcriptional regulator [Rickettsiales bacterium]|nr:LysR family transcriptional regulator [Rickettsiales bacterium]
MGNQFYYKRNRLQQLRGFYYAAKFSSMSKAAKFMSLNQSAVTLQIQSLERDLKVKLFKRSGKSIELTEDGKLLYELAVPMVQGIDGIHQKFEERKKSLHVEQVNIAADYILISHLLPKYLKSFREKYPDVEIKIHDIARLDAMDRLLNDELDMVVYPTSDVSPECYFRSSFQYPPLLTMQKNHPLASVDPKDIDLAEVGKYEFLTMDRSLITLPLFNQVCETYNWDSHIKFEFGNLEMIKNFVKGGLGLAVISAICITEYDTDLIGKDMTHHFPYIKYGIMIKKGANLSNAALNFINNMDPDFFGEGELTE